MTNMSKTPFDAMPGWLIVKPYVDKEATFVSEKESAGFSQKSEVLEVGKPVVDSYGILRKPPCKKGNIIIHEYAQNEFEIGFDKYRAIHFSQVIGIKL
jgi:co-chaperonin GroES (HSP10)